MQAPRNQWYCAAFGHELKQDPMARMILSEPVAMYRKADGTPVAFEDRCCHRRAPLSHGKVEGDNLRCGYHGLLYAPTGAAIWAPGQDRLPSGARVRTYPLVEKHGWIWIWMGDPALADPKTAPTYDKYDDPQWASYDELIPVKANYFLVVDNLLDLSHLPFVHAATIGSPEDTNPNLAWERGANSIRGVRNARGLSPSQVTIDIVTNEFGKEYGDPSSRLNRRIMIYDAITPETDTCSHYFWAIARDYLIDDPKQDELGLRATSAAFHEDQRILEAQQRIISTDPNAAQIDLAGDSGGLQARRIMERLLAEERGARQAAQ
jgi:phenylpropionate dioxygenase-like ring-hydroxylating dioxygenase large terminal subunit